MTESKIPEIIREHQQELVAEWVQAQTASVRSGLIREGDVRSECTEFLNCLVDAMRRGNIDNISRPEYDPVKETLAHVSRSRSERGFSPTETATFVFSLKKPLFARLRAELRDESDDLFEELWAVDELVDQFGLYTAEAYQSSRETVIQRQQAEMLELSTPVIKLWEGILAVPLIGTLDSERTQVVMETLLERIVETSSEVAIIDITGVPTVDTLVAQHLLKAVAAARLMGVECIISGVRPQIAQTVVHLGIALEDVRTKASLADAFKLALTNQGLRVSRPTQG